MPGPGLALDEFRNLLGVEEVPLGSNNAPPVTTWYGANDLWCAMTCSYVLTHVGIRLKTALVSEIIDKAQAGDDGWSWHSDPQLGDCVSASTSPIRIPLPTTSAWSRRFEAMARS